LRITNSFSSAWDDIRGFIDRREKVIYLDKSQHINRQNFVKLHEVGHDILEWQGHILECADNDETLDPNVKEEFEAEANYFASATYFQQDRFDREVRNMGVSIKSALAIAQKFGASIHATLRRMVEFQNKSCALIVLEKKSSTHCKRRNVFQSVAFSSKFGDIFLPEEMDRVLPFAADYLNGRKLQVDRDVVLPTSDGLATLKYEFFYNGWNGLVLVFPEGELAGPKKRYIFKGIEEI
jgi:hypothetical protein